MKRRLLLKSILILTVIASIWFYPKIDRYFMSRPVKKADLLRNEIVASITNPFAQADTVILDTGWGFCGNSDPNELPIVFETYIENENYKQLLSNRIQKPVLTMNEFQKVMDTVRQSRFNGEYPPSLWDTCRIGKVSAGITAEQLSPKKIRLYENYLYSDVTKYVRKEFVFNDSKWTFTITDTSTQANSR